MTPATIKKSSISSIKKKKIKKQQATTWFIRALSYALPLIILTLVVYINTTPLGYQKIILLDIGSARDTSPPALIEINSSVGSRQQPDGASFRTLNGVTNVVYKPSVNLSGAMVSTTVNGEGVFFPDLPDMNINWHYHWKTFDKFMLQMTPQSMYKYFLNGTETPITDIELDEPFALTIHHNATNDTVQLLSGDINITQSARQFTITLFSNKPQEARIVIPLSEYYLDNHHEILLGHSSQELFFFVDKQLLQTIPLPIPLSTLIIPPYRHIGTISAFSSYQEPLQTVAPKKNSDGCITFDGHSRLILPDTADAFEQGPFVIAVEWTPQTPADFQQIIGHFNWEISQHSDRVEFTIGRVNNSRGARISVGYPIDESFFGKQHYLVATYNPSANGYIDLYVDDHFAQRRFIDDAEIWTGYGNADLSLGKTLHHEGHSPYFEGNICNVRFAYRRIDETRKTQMIFTAQEDAINIPIMGSGQLDSVIIEVAK